jgi:drug/metabolite transporter (DMT)-like permease
MTIRYSVLYVIDSAISRVLIDFTISNIPITIVLFGVSIVAIIFFSLINFKSILNTYKKFFFDFKGIQLFIGLNLSVLSMWVLTYLGIDFVGASMSAYLFFMSLSLATSILKNHQFKFKGIIFILIFILFMIIAILSLDHMIYAIIPILAGISGFIYNVISTKTTAKIKLKTSETLACRYWALIIFLPFFMPENTSSYINPTNIFLIITIGTLSFILQVWFAQKGLDNAGINRHSFIIMYSPAATYILEGIFLGGENYTLLILSLITPPIILLRHWLSD